MNSAAQMICGGVALLLVGVVLGEPFRTDWSHVSARSMAALAYLIVFGSWMGFSAYVWSLKVSTPSRVSTYAYVNPGIAVFLGWALLGESLNAHMLFGALVVLAGVTTIAVLAGAAATVAMRIWLGSVPRKKSAGRGTDLPGERAVSPRIQE